MADGIERARSRSRSPAWSRHGSSTLDDADADGRKKGRTSIAKAVGREFAMKAVRLDGHYLGMAQEFREDDEIVMAAVAQNGIALYYATEALRADREIVQMAVSQNGIALQYAAEELRGDNEVVLKAVSQNGCALQFAAETLKANREIVKKAVSQNGWALEDAGEELRGDREIVTLAVSQHGLALRYATEALRGDRAVVMTAVSQHGAALECASEELRGDEELLQLAFKSCASEVLALKVLLLSGRHCTQLFRRSDHVQFVMWHCAKLLELDPDHAAARGTLMCGETKISALKQLEPSKLHEATLVLS